MSEIRLIETLLAELRAAFPDDPSAPGIVFSQVKSARFYAAAARYRKPIGEGREVVAVGRASDILGALRRFAEDWNRKRVRYDVKRERACS